MVIEILALPISTNVTPAQKKTWNTFPLKCWQTQSLRKRRRYWQQLVKYDAFWNAHERDKRFLARSSHRSDPLLHRRVDQTGRSSRIHHHNSEAPTWRTRTT